MLKISVPITRTRRGKRGLVGDRHLQHEGVIGNRSPTMICGENGSSIHGHVLQPGRFDPEVVEVDVVAQVPQHLGNHRVQPESVDVVARHLQVAQ